jgi:hypothetical protein
VRIALILVLLCSGCSWNVFQARVPSAVVKTQSHLESERIAGDFLARNVNEQNKQVATSLSHSLGLPIESSNDAENISENLNEEISENRKNQNQLNETLNKYAGKEIEGTGIDIGKGLSITSIVLLMIAIVAFPSIISILFFLLRQSRSALSAIVSGVETFKQSDKEHGKELKTILSASMDKQHKKLIQKLK